MSNKLEQIRKTVAFACELNFDRLRMEEEILISFVKNSNNSMNEKGEAFKRIKEINKLQLEILGEKIRIG